MAAEWSNEKVLKFVHLYGQQRVIWDPNDKNHKSKRCVYDAWDRLSSSMNLPVEDLKTKKKSLMATFRSLMKRKISAAKAGGDEAYANQPMWFAFEPMERYLGPIYDSEETINNDNEKYEPEDNSCLQLPPKVEPPPPASPMSEDATTHENNFRKKRKLTTPEDEINRAQKNIIQTLDTLKHVLQNRKEEDEIDLYCKLLARRLRRYPDLMRQRLMYEIDGLILKNLTEEDSD